MLYADIGGWGSGKIVKIVSLGRFGAVVLGCLCSLA